MNTNNERSVEFDIAVTIEESNSASGKAGVKVLQFVQVGGKADLQSRNETVSRISFGVYVNTWTKDKQKLESRENRDDG